MNDPAHFIRTEIRLIKPDQYFLDEQGRVCHKVGRRFPRDPNTRLGIKHLARADVPYSPALIELRAHALIWADPDPRRRDEFPLDYAYELMPGPEISHQSEEEPA